VGISIIGIFAHPDDEVMGAGGVLAAAAVRGEGAALVCATRGEVGEISDPSLATPETLGSVREQELRCAAKALGIPEPIFLDYRDSGMAGTEANQDPRSLAMAPREEVTAKLVGILRRLRPQVVVTFDVTGGYGHPDHIAIHYATLEAFHAAGDATRFPELGEAWQADGLYYMTFRRELFELMRQLIDARGGDTSFFNRLRDEAVEFTTPRVDAVIDVGDFTMEKWRAFKCHKTQFGPQHPFHVLTEEDVRLLFAEEAFERAYPPGPPETILTSLYRAQ
jgi:LmbE family N-acetylglucosaminyl deacetylase